MRSIELNGRSVAPLYVALAAFALALATPPGDPERKECRERMEVRAARRMEREQKRLREEDEDE